MNGEEGEIYFSPRAERFYQEGRRGVLSRERALSGLRFDEDAGAFRDQRGRLVPDEYLSPVERRVQRIAGLDAEGQPFVRTVMVDDKIAENAARNLKPAGNQQVIVRIVAKMDDGVAIVGEASSKLGKAYSLDALEEQAKKNARAKAKDAGYDVDTPDVSKRTIGVSYLKRSVAIE